MEIPGYQHPVMIGRGGFATVYRAVQESMNREVAVKVLVADITGVDARDRFRREATTNGRVSAHPNIVTLFDSGFATDGQPYLAMQLCPGGSLAQRVRDSGPLPLADVLRIGVKISAALAYAHSAGVLHRDIKPENILLTEFDEPVLADFGIAAVDDHRMSTVTAASFTIHHAAPETLSGSPPSASSDVYSLCSTLFTMLVGQPPFQGNSSALAALVYAVVHNPAPPLPASVPRPVADVLERGLAKDPAQRPADARALGAALQEAEQRLGLPVTAFPVAPPPTVSAPTVVLGNGATLPATAAFPATAAVPATAAQSGPDTQVGPVATGAPPPAPMPADQPASSRKTWWLAAAAVAVVAAVVAVIIWASGLSGSPSVAPTTSAGRTSAGTGTSAGSTSQPQSRTTSSSATRTAADPVISRFVASSAADGQVTCAAGADAEQVTFSWSSTGGSEVYLGVDTGGASAKDKPTLSGLAGSGTAKAPFDCGASSHTYTLTVANAGGATSQTLTLTRQQAVTTSSAPSTPASASSTGGSSTESSTEPPTTSSTRTETSGDTGIGATSETGSSGGDAAPAAPTSAAAPVTSGDAAAGEQVSSDPSSSGGTTAGD